MLVEERAVRMRTNTHRAVDTTAVWHEFAKLLRAFIAARVSGEADHVLQTVYLHIHHRLPSLRDDSERDRR